MSKVFNTRLSEETIEKIKAYAWHKRVNIQDVSQAAMDEFFANRSDESEKALEAYRNKENGI